MELKPGSKIFMDTAPIIYFIEENPFFGNIAAGIFKRVAQADFDVMTSVLTLTEVLSMPYKTGREDIAESYKEFFNNSERLTLIDINSEIADLAAGIRARYGFKTPDAIQLGSFEYSGCDYFVTNDSSLKKYDQKKVVVLTELKAE